jgi:DNA-3-methyladenine glycosylase
VPLRFELPRKTERERLLRVLSLPPEQAAPKLLGSVLLRRAGRRVYAARLVEVEAYLGARDPAAHAFRGRTPRTAPLFGAPGTLYVYLVYGMYHCLNLATDRAGTAGCVLLRAAEGLPGSGLAPGALSGPGRLCRSLGIDVRLTGRQLFETDAVLTLREGSAPKRIEVSRRVGIRRATERRLRFFDADSPAVSSA